MFFLFSSILGISCNLIFIVIFYIRKKHLDWLEKYGKYSFLLLLPAVASLIVGIIEKVPSTNYVFLGIFFLYMGLEFVYEFWLKIDFRHNWKLATPYILLYYMMNYGLVMMPWAFSLTMGGILLGLMIIQYIVNFWSHK
ncbi:MAG: hypothetical protein E4G98_00240 [Promethearchaeota archaeon]|nr:MAG: hypothetical protein E4G98_00240 [Candidatus Lokiarchaeota archaeon]